MRKEPRALTPRERALFDYLAEKPRTRSEMCERFGFKGENLRRHLANIRGKLAAGGITYETLYSLTPGSRL